MSVSRWLRKPLSFMRVRWMLRLWEELDVVLLQSLKGL